MKNTSVLMWGICFICVAFILSCNNKTVSNINNSNALNSNIKILALGDSYTIGQSVTEEERYITQTISILNKKGKKIKSSAQIIAQTGWTTLDLLDAIEADSINMKPPYDVVTLQIGVNDQFQQYNKNDYYTNFELCLKKALILSGNVKSNVFVLSIPDYGATPFGSGNALQIGREIDFYNAVNKKISLQMGVNYIDITPSSRLAVTDGSLIAGDGLHPSGKEYLKWANLLAAKILPLIK